MIEMKDLFGNTVEVATPKRSRKEVFNDYDGFVEKFKTKKTTDDCYTPQPVYDAVLGWVRENTDIEGREIIRPFYPGGDYENYEYPDGCVVVDNPPFSIISKIARFYTARGIMFFLFAPHLTLFNAIRGAEATGIVCNSVIVYENGAKVNTSFISNLFDDIRIMTAPELLRRIRKAQTAPGCKTFSRYAYPDCVVSSALLGKIAHHVDFRVRASECCQISRLDLQGGKAIYGGGFLISEKAAAEKVAAEKVAAERTEEREVQVCELSDRERQIVKKLSSK